MLQWQPSGELLEVAEVEEAAAVVVSERRSTHTPSDLIFSLGGGTQVS